MLVRSCIACRKKDLKYNLLRIVKDEKNNAIYDEKQKINSRAIYLCKNKKCIEIALKKLLKNKLNIKIGISNNSFEVLLKDLKQILDELGE